MADRVTAGLAVLALVLIGMLAVAGAQADQRLPFAAPVHQTTPNG